jgi:hypothetical protein
VDVVQRIELLLVINDKGIIIAYGIDPPKSNVQPKKKTTLYRVTGCVRWGEIVHQAVFSGADRD